VAGAEFDVAIVIPAWNGWELTEPCLRSIAAHTPGDRYQVVLADNGSTDQTPTEGVALGANLFANRFVHHRLPENLGFATACNQGAAAASAAHLLFLNNDTVVTENWLPPLLDGLRADPRLAGVGPLLLFPDDNTVRANRVQHLGIAASQNLEFRHLYEYFPRTHPAVNRRRKLGVITAAALLMPARLFQAENGFFEGFRNGMEDVDLCCRIAARGGHFSVIPESVVHHHTHGTEGRFAHESENLRLLRARCRRPVEDLYDLVLEDGFEPGFTPWLDLVVKLPAHRAAELDRRYQADPAPDRLALLLDQNPLWDQGHELLTDHLSERGMHAEAAAAAYFRSLLCPGIRAYEHCLRTARQAGFQDMARRYSQTLANLRAALADQTALADKVRSLAASARHPALRAALEEWQAV
jgi:GT2 family glycosyltransferase